MPSLSTPERTEVLNLHEAAMAGDERAFRRALARGEDVNSSDTTGRTVLACLILDDQSIDESDETSVAWLSQGRLRILHYLLDEQKLSLYTLNSAQDGLGRVTPLTMATYLNKLDFVSSLLSRHPGLVCVDGLDAQSATPLMYATRDGSSSVVQCLLLHGARPERRDVNHHSAIQYALGHPLSLHLCESALRARRVENANSGKYKFNLSIPPSSFPSSSLYHHSNPSISAVNTPSSSSANALRHAIQTSDLTALHSLFSSLTPSFSSTSSKKNVEKCTLSVNLPDSKGWSAIHYCTTANPPNIQILDFLFLAGADVGLFTSFDHKSPLHCLVRSAQSDKNNESAAKTLRTFIIHLVRDLGAPLYARDADGETCVHVAAQYGRSLTVWKALLECDVSGTVLQMQNSKGLTPLELIRTNPHLSVLVDDPLQRPGTSASIATLRPMPRVVSAGTTQYQSVRRRGFSVSSVPDAEVTDRLFSNLKLISTALRDPHSNSAADLSQFMELIQDSSHLGSILIHRFQQGLDELILEQLHADKLYAKLDKMTEKLQTEFVQPKKMRKPGKDLTPSIASSTSKISHTSFLDGTFNVGVAPSLDSSPLRNVPLNMMPETPSPRRKLTWPSWMRSLVSPSLGKTEVTEENLWLTYSRIEQTELKSKNGVQEEQSTRGRSFSHSRFPRLSRSKIWRKEKEKNKDKPHSSDRDREEHYVVGSLSSGVSSMAASTYELPGSKYFRAAASSPSLCSSSLSSNGTSALEPMTPEEQFASLPSTGSISYVAFPTIGGGNGMRDDVDRDRVDLAGLHVIDHVKNDLSNLNELMSGVDNAVASMQKTLKQTENLLHKVIHDKQTTLQSQRLSRALEAMEGINKLWASSPISTASSPNPDYPLEQPFSPTPPVSPVSLMSVLQSPSGSTVSLSNTAVEDSEGDDVRALKRLVLRKLPARLDGITDELEKLNTWLYIIRDTLRHCYQKSTVRVASNVN